MTAKKPSERIEELYDSLAEADGIALAIKQTATAHNSGPFCVSSNMVSRFADDLLLAIRGTGAASGEDP